MDRLNPEIIYLIFDEVKRLHQADTEKVWNNFGRYAAISRVWQAVVERQTLKRIIVPSSPEGMSRFTSIFSQAHRRSYLQLVVLFLTMPTNATTDEEHRQNEKALGAAASALLHEIHHWERNVPDENLMPLDLKLCLRWPDRDPHRHRSEASYHYLTISDTDIAELPKPRRIKHFRDGGGSLGKTLHPTSLCRLACILPLLESVDFELLDPGFARPELRLQHRNALADGISAMRTSLPRLRKFKLRDENGDSPDNHSYRCQNLEDEQGVDKLCEAIRILSQMDGFQELRLNIPNISPDLFWDRRRHPAPANAPANPNEDRSVWPSLRVFDIDCGIVAPNGQWYYTGDPRKTGAMNGEGSEDDEFDTDYGRMNTWQESDDSEAEDDPPWLWPQHLWRMDPDPETLDSLAISMAAAVRRMPNLRSGTLYMDFPHSNWRAICLQCVEPNARFSVYEDDGDGSAFRRWRAVVERNARWEAPAELVKETNAWIGKDPIKVVRVD